MFFIVLSWPPASRRLSVSRWLSVTGFFLTVVNRRADTPPTERGIPSSNGRIERVPLLGCCPEVEMISKRIIFGNQTNLECFRKRSWPFRISPYWTDGPALLHRQSSGYERYHPLPEEANEPSLVAVLKNKNDDNYFWKSNEPRVEAALLAARTLCRASTFSRTLQSARRWPIAGRSGCPLYQQHTGVYPEKEESSYWSRMIGDLFYDSDRSLWDIPLPSVQTLRNLCMTCVRNRFSWDILWQYDSVPNKRYLKWMYFLPMSRIRNEYIELTPLDWIHFRLFETRTKWRQVS